MRELDEAPDTLGKIYPEATTLAEKAILFLALKDSVKSFREMARAIGPMPDTGALLHHQTISRLYKFLKDTEVYAQYTWEKNEQVKDFLSHDFLGVIHDDYKEQRERIEAQIKAALARNDELRALDWIREKRMLLKDMVQTAINLSPKQPRLPVSPSPTDEKSGTSPYTEDYETALENYKRSTPDA